MKVISRKTRDLVALCRAELEDRKGTYENRSQEWRDGERGERYAEIISEIKRVSDDLEYLSDLLEEEVL